MQPSKNGSLLRPRWLIATAIALCFVIPFYLLRPVIFEHLESWLPATKESEKFAIEEPPEPQPEFYEWHTRSSFSPARFNNVADKTTEELCASFPTQLLDEIQPVLKTGHGVLERVQAQLQSVSACLSNLLIFSDLDEDFAEYSMIDVVADIPTNLTANTDQLDTYKTMHHFASNGSLTELNATAKEGWKIDKFKFLAGVSRAWKMRPERRWYVFFEDDTYIVWDNIFRLLDHFDADVPLYFGSPSPGRDPSWFAYGGAGYVISRAAMRRLVDEDWDSKTGEYLGSILTERNWHDLIHDCCGDSALGWALWKKNVSLSGLWPMFNPHPPHGVPFSDLYWCQPVLTMHKPQEQDATHLWRWQWEHRKVHRPLLYRDLALYTNITSLTTLDDWDNASWDAYRAPKDGNGKYTHDPDASISACKSACEAWPDCFQWTYHLRKCKFVHSIRLGVHKDPGLDEKKLTEEEKAIEWSQADLRYMAGWAVQRVQKWIDEHPCEKVEWVRPSIKRVF